MSTFIYPSSQWSFGTFPVFSYQNGTSMNIYGCLLVNKQKSFSMFYTLEVVIWGHSIYISLIQLGDSVLFSKELASILPTSNKRKFPLFHILYNSYYQTFGNLVNIKMKCVIVFICSSLISNEMGYLCSSLTTLFFSSVKCLLLFLALFFFAVMFFTELQAFHIQSSS